MSERRDFVLQAPIGRAIWSLSWPIVLSNQLSILTITVLLYWLGRIVGETGLVVESLFRPFGLLFAWFFGATSVGAGVLVSRSVGAADGKGLSIAAGGVTLTIAMWLVLVAIVAPLSPWLAGLLAGDLPVDRPMLHFLLGWLLMALPALSIAEVLLDVANSTGATRFNLVRVLLDLAFMAALAPVLMSVAGMGIAGGPTSEGLAALGLCGVLWIALVRGRAALELGEVGEGAWRIRWALWKEVLVIGVPVQLGRMAMFVAQIILVQMVMRDGAPTVAGYGIAGALLLFGLTATLAIAQGGAILIGQSLGAGQPERARRGVRVALIAGWLTMGAFVIATLFDRPLIGLFTSDPAITTAAEHALGILRWGGFGIATWQISLACFSAHRTTVRASLLIILGEACGLVVAFAWRGSHLDSACIAFVAANVLKGALLLGLIASGALERARAKE